MAYWPKMKRHALPILFVIATTVLILGFLDWFSRTEVRLEHRLRHPDFPPKQAIK